MTHRSTDILSELRRRKVPRAVAAYVLVALAVVEGADIVFANLLLPAWTTRLVVVLALAGFPVTVVLAWWFDLTPDGIRRAPPSGAGTRVRAVLAGAVILLTAGAGWAGWIRWWGPAAGPAVTGSAAPALTRVAVLYFDDHSPAGDLGYLAAGLTEELIHQLSQVDALDVVSRNGVKTFRDRPAPLDTIVATLAAGTLVEGSVQRSGDQLRVTVQLIDGQSGVHLQSRTLERPWGELFQLQEAVAEAVAVGLRERLGEAVQLQARRGGTSSVEAWESFQRAQRVAERMVTAAAQDDTVQADRFLAEADALLAETQALDPDWPEPAVERGWLHARSAVATDAEYVLRSRETLAVRTAEALASAEEALALAPGHAGALELRGFVRMVHWVSGLDPSPATRDRAMADLEAAVERDPARARAWRLASNLAMKAGDFDSGLYNAERALRADAFLEDADDIYGLLYETNLNLERVDEATRWCEEGRRRFPESTLLAVCGLFTLASTDGDTARIDDGWRRLDTYMAVSEAKEVGWNRALGLTLMAAILARAELPDSARAVMTRARAALPAGDANAPFYNYYDAYVATLLGDTDRALDLLTTLLGDYPSQREFLANDWWFRPLRDEPGFRDLTGPS